MVTSVIVYIIIVKGVGKVSFALFRLSLCLNAVFCVFLGGGESRGDFMGLLSDVFDWMR